MSDLWLGFDELVYGIPTEEMINPTSQQALRDFKERDYDRRLELLKVHALIIIADRLASKEL